MEYNVSRNLESGEADIKPGKWDILSPLVFVSALMPLSFNLRKVKAAYEFSGGIEKFEWFEVI